MSCFSTIFLTISTYGEGGVMVFPNCITNVFVIQIGGGSKCAPIFVEYDSEHYYNCRPMMQLKTCRFNN